MSEVLGITAEVSNPNLDPYTGYFDCLCLSLGHPYECMDITVKQATTASFQILIYS
jgi:hypothetical protein